MADQKSFVQRMIGAATLDVDTYEEVEHDLDGTMQAAGVVAIVAICAAIGGASLGSGGIVGRPLGALAGWAVWSGVTYLIGDSALRRHGYLGRAAADHRLRPGARGALHPEWAVRPGFFGGHGRRHLDADRGGHRDSAGPRLHDG